MNLAELCDCLGRFPGCEIVYFKKGRLCRRSYPEAGEDARRISSWLSGSGVRRGMRIGILAENCYEWILCEVASLQLGCVLVSFPPDEFAHASFDSMAEKYGLHLLLVSTREYERRNTPRTWVARMDDEGPWEISIREISAPAGPADRADFTPDSDIYSLVFSSGTSGKLKCILMSRRGTELLVDAYGRNYKFEPDDHILAVLPLSNFQQRLMMYTAIWYGFSLQVVDPPLFFRALKEMRPTILAGPPAFYETIENRFRNLPPFQRALLTTAAWLARSLTFGGLRQKLLQKIFRPFHEAYGGKIRLMLTGSAPIRESTLILFEKMGFPLYQVYGLTEAGFVAWNLPGRNRRGSVGKPVFEGGASLAEDGEIIAHPPVSQSRGYLADEEEQARTFPSAGKVATGDIGRFDKDGFLYIVGRKKQIIITQGGYKLHPEPVEKEIESCPEVARAVLFGGGDLPLLVALVSLRNGDSAELRRKVLEHVKQINLRLPPPARVGRTAFIATTFTRENGLLTRNLKIDRQSVYRMFQRELMGMETPSEVPRGKPHECIESSR